jgi:hypothetical protein
VARLERWLWGMAWPELVAFGAAHVVGLLFVPSPVYRRPLNMQYRQQKTLPLAAQKTLPACSAFPGSSPAVISGELQQSCRNIWFVSTLALSTRILFRSPGSHLPGGSCPDNDNLLKLNHAHILKESACMSRGLLLCMATDLSLCPFFMKCASFRCNSA